MPRGSSHCPKCDHELSASSPQPSRRKINLPMIEAEDEEETSEPDDTGFIAGIESAIPGPEPEDSPGARHDRMPRPRTFAFAAVLALVVVGGSTLLITHPWDPLATQTKATEPADVSMSGFPGVVESLSGQDDEGGAGQAEATTTYEILEDVHDELGDLSERVDSSEEALRSLVDGSVKSESSEGLEDARAISISVSNVIARLDRLAYAGGPYDDDFQNLKTLGSWLRNRCDALTDAWELAADSEDPTSVSASVDAMLDESLDYARRFSENFDAWEPTDKG